MFGVTYIFYYHSNILEIQVLNQAMKTLHMEGFPLCSYTATWVPYAWMGEHHLGVLKLRWRSASTAKTLTAT